MKQVRDFVNIELENLSVFPSMPVPGKSVYTDAEKRMIISYYLSGKVNISALSSRFFLSKRTIYSWISKFADGKGGLATRRLPQSPTKTPSAMPKKKATPSETPEEELARLREENKKLQEALKMAEWSNHAKDVMIDLAEKTFNIPIRKKSGAKQ